MTLTPGPLARPYGVACAFLPAHQGRGLLAAQSVRFPLWVAGFFGVSGHGRSMGLHQSPVYGIGSAASPAQ